MAVRNRDAYIGENVPMRELMILMIAVFAAVSSTWAKLGDSGDMIEDSYGAVVQRRLGENETVSVIYISKGYLYLVTFANDRSISESYSHVKGAELSEKEITKFLKANAANAKWISGNTGTIRRFTRSDGKAEAVYAPVNGRPALTVRELHSRHRHSDQ
jgi:hypothetical protein